MTLNHYVAAYFDSIESLECETSIALTEKEYKNSFIMSICFISMNRMKPTMI